MYDPDENSPGDADAHSAGDTDAVTAGAARIGAGFDFPRFVDDIPGDVVGAAEIGELRAIRAGLIVESEVIAAAEARRVRLLARASEIAQARMSRVSNRVQRAEEEAVLQVRAKALNVTVARLLVETTLADGDGKTAVQRRDELAELFHMRRLLASVSNNVNQIARSVNAGNGVDAELKHTLAAVDRVCGSLDEYMSASVVGR
jgi:hypothetical protein